MTINQLLKILIKLIGLIFILISCIYIIPGYVNLIVTDEFVYPSEILENPDIAMSTSLVITDIVINILIYYFFIYKTDFILKLLHIDSELGEQRIGHLNLNIQKYTQITLAVIAILFITLSIPNLIISVVENFRVKSEYSSIDSFNLIENIIISLIAISLLIFNKNISNVIAK